MNRTGAMVLLLVLCPAVLSAQASTYIHVGDPVYRLLERFAALELIEPTATAIRPLSTTAVERLLAEAREPIPASRMAEYAMVTGSDRYIDQASLELTVMDSPRVPYPDNNIGGVDAFINPLAAGSNARVTGDGLTMRVESRHSAVVGSHVAVFAQPRASFTSNDRTATADLRFQQLYARALAAGLALDVGRMERRWGQSRVASLAMSGNARAPWGVRLVTDGTITLPSLLRYAGLVHGDVFWSDLGGDQNFPGANLIGWRLLIHPSRYFQLGAVLLAQYGGDGAPDYAATDIFEDVFLPFLDQREVTQHSNKLAGIEFRVRVPKAAGLSVYGEIVLDDVDLNPDRFRYWLAQDVGHIYGVELMKLTRTADLAVYLEYHHTGNRYYRHLQFNSGLTYEQDIIGNPLGPDADAVYAGVIRDLESGGKVTVQAAFERRSADRYLNEIPADRWPVIEDRPEEDRLRLTAAWHLTPRGSRFGIRTELGLERATNFGFQQDAARTNAIARVRVETSRFH